MGTNYYAMKKEHYEKERKIRDTLNVYNSDKLKEKILTLLKKEYKSLIDLLDKDEIDLYYDDLEEQVDTFIHHLQYNVNEELVRKKNQIHIGKSSVGWLFNFQDQYLTDCSWHNYDQVFNWLKHNTYGDKAKYVIVDEYNRLISYEKLKDLVDTKQKDPHNLKNPDNFTYCRNVDGYRFSTGDFS